MSKYARRFILLLIFAVGQLLCRANEIVMPARGLCAHRGNSETHPENTLPAFREAVRLGAQMIEFDIRLTKDNALVLMHDETVDRTTNGKGKVSDLTLAEIRKLDAGSWKDKVYAGTRIPTFEEALAVMPRNVWLNCHLKGDDAAGTAAAKALVKAGRIHQSFLACSEIAAGAAKNVNRNIRICNMETKYRSDVTAYVNSTIVMKAEFLQFISDSKDKISKELIAPLKTNGIRINYYYAKDPSELAGLFASGIDFILVNDIARFQNAMRAIVLRQ